MHRTKTGTKPAAPLRLIQGTTQARDFGLCFTQARRTATVPQGVSRMKSLVPLHLLSLSCCIATTSCSLDRGGSLPAAGDRDMTIDDANNASNRDAATDARARGPTDGGPSEEADAMIPIGEDPRDVVLGFYAERRAFRTIQQVMSPLFNSDVNVLTTSYSLVEIKRIGARYVFRENACRVLTKNDGAFVSLDVTIADDVPQSIPEIESELLVEEASGAVTWVRPLTSAPVGWIPNGSYDALPTSASDPRVRDAEGDGSPGVTARVRANLGLFGVTEGNLYLTQWNRARYAGTRLSNGKLEGENFDTSEQNVIGSDNQSLAGNNPTIVRDPNTADNRILLVPLEVPITCATLLSRVNRLFP